MGGCWSVGGCWSAGCNVGGCIEGHTIPDAGCSVGGCIEEHTSPGAGCSVGGCIEEHTSPAAGCSVGKGPTCSGIFEGTAFVWANSSGAPTMSGGGGGSAALTSVPESNDICLLAADIGMRGTGAKSLGGGLSGVLMTGGVEETEEFSIDRIVELSVGAWQLFSKLGAFCNLSNAF